ncbi:hypothetical protein ACFQ2Y_41790 [Streptomyces malaysiensis subsp. malaysiensis]
MSAATTTPKTTDTRKTGTSSGKNDRTVTFTVPRVAMATANVAAVPIRTARRVLPAKGGLPLYLGLGAMGLAGVLEWPIAVGVGVGYAVLRNPRRAPRLRTRRAPPPECRPAWCHTRGESWSSSLTGGRNSPSRVRCHQAPVARRSAGVVKR